MGTTAMQLSVALLVCSFAPLPLALDLRGRAPVPVLVADSGSQADPLVLATQQVEREVQMPGAVPGAAAMPGAAAPGGMPAMPGAMMPGPVVNDVDAQAAGAAALAAAAGPQLSDASCAAAAARLGAMTCTLVAAQPPGFAPPEGCECRMQAAACPPADPTLGFTGVSPSQTFSLPEMRGISVVDCMYWQWLAAPDTTVEKAMTAAQTSQEAEKMVQEAHARADAWVTQLMGPLGPAPCPAPGPDRPGPCPVPAPAPGAAPAPGMMPVPR